MVSSTCVHAEEETLRFFLKKLPRTAAWVYCHIENCRSPVTIRRQGMIQPDDVSFAEIRIISQAQQQVSKEEMRAVQAGKELSSESKL